MTSARKTQNLCIVLAVSVIVMAGCSIDRPSGQVSLRLSNSLEVSVNTTTTPPEFLDKLDRLELKRDGGPYRFTVDPSVVPEYSVYTGSVNGGSPTIVTTTVPFNSRVRHYSTIDVTGNPGVAFTISSPKNWLGLAGPAARADLDQYRLDCENSSRSRAKAKYGYSFFVEPRSGDVVEISDITLLDCTKAGYTKAFGLLLHIGSAKLLISNISGKFYLEEISQ